MSRPGNEDLSRYSMLELFKVEAENQTAVLTSGLLELERAPGTTGHFEPLMRAAHSIKGAARIVNLQAAVRVAHAMEDCFAAAQRGGLRVGRAEIDVLLRGVDLLVQLSKRTETDISGWYTDHAGAIEEFLSAAARLVPSAPQPAAPPSAAVVPAAAHPSPAPPPPAAKAPVVLLQETPERVVRITAESLNRLLGLAGESLVESRWLGPFADGLLRLKRQQTEMMLKLEQLRLAMGDTLPSEAAGNFFNNLFRQMADCSLNLAGRIQDLDGFDRRSAHLSQRLYLEVLRTRMRPFGDGARRFPRMVRDLARSLGKEVRLEITGEATQVDRDILERLEAPLAHLLRNSVDHGCETPAQRRRAGKPAECLIRLEARHSAGVLLVSVADDGAGVSPSAVRDAAIRQRLVTPAKAEKLSDAELMEFLFFPGFTLKETVTEISGRGFGLDVVQNMVKSVRGVIRLANQPGRGLRVQLQLPLTLSVVRALLIEAGGEPYAIPLAQISRTLKLPRDAIQSVEGRSHFEHAGQQIGLLPIHQVLDCEEPQAAPDKLSVVILGERSNRYGLVVDRFLGERELVVQPLDGRLGKIPEISAAALMEDGAPALILDVDDLIKSIDRLAQSGRLPPWRSLYHQSAPRKQKRVLAVDDSLTVREMERKLLLNSGYLADVAVDGLEGWKTMQSNTYDLVITDVDMPRMDGIELASRIKRDPRLKSVPVLIVSYKDREEDRIRGLEAGADYYLTKGGFQDHTLLQAVADLIGEPDA